MDLEKIGKFISAKRKEANLTQAELAERLNITDRAVSKWETGRSMPDSSIMLELCSVLGITVNELLSGETISMENYNKEMEKNLLEMIKQKERADKWLLTTEVVAIAVCISLLLALEIFAAVAPLDTWLRIALICIGVLPTLIAFPFLIRIEQKAGYYECARCGHRYVPSYKMMLWSMHMGRTRYMKCPKCGQKSWQKKVVSKTEDEGNH